MKPHVESVSGNLVTSADDGSVWACWQVMDVPFRHTSADDRLRHRAAVEGMLAALPGPALMFSVCQPVPVERIERALRTEAIPSARLDRRVDLTLSRFEDGQIFYERTFWLAAQVRKARNERVSGQLRRSGGRLWAALPFSDSPIFDDERRVRGLRVAAVELEHGLGLSVVSDVDQRPELPDPGKLVVRRAALTDLEWLVVRMARRGTGDDLPLSEWARDDGSADKTRMMRLGGAGWRENYTGPSASAGMARCVAACDDDCAVSFQSTLVVAGAPTEVWFPGGWSEWLARAGNNGGAFPVDWFVRLVPRRDAKFRRKLDTRLTNALEQEEEHDDEAGPARHVYQDTEALKQLRDRVADGDVVFEAVTWYTICAPDYDTLEDRVREFRGRWSQDVWDLQRPVGQQMDYVRASQPGAVLPDDVASDYRRYPTADLLASGAPFAGAQVGDPFGALIAVNLSDGLAGLVHWDPGFGIRHENRSGSAFFIGVTGAGKSTSMKSVIDGLIARGSRVVVIDPVGEYLDLCGVLAGQKVDPFDPHVSLDPLAIFTHLPASTDDKARAEARERAANAAVGIFDALWSKGIEPHGPVWSRLRQLIDHALDNAGKLCDILTWIRADITESAAAHAAAVDDARTVGAPVPPPPRNDFEELIGPLEVAARLPRLGSIFNPVLAPMRVYTPLTVVVTTGIKLPKGDKDKASAEELQGLAVMLAALHAAKEGVYVDRSRYGAVVFDEGRVLIATPYGREMVHDLLDQGRKYFTGALISMTDPTVVPDQFLGQADTRFMFRLADASAVDAVLPHLGPAGQDPAMRDVLLGLRNGECVFRDIRGRVSRVRMLLPLDPDVAAVVGTTPVLDLTPDVEDDVA